MKHLVSLTDPKTVRMPKVHIEFAEQGDMFLGRCQAVLDAYLFSNLQEIIDIIENWIKEYNGPPT